MSSSFFKTILLYFLILLILIFFISFIVLTDTSYSESFSNLNGEFIWPLPGYSYISSYFGRRSSPTAGASTYHSGIDIPAPDGTKILAVCDGIVTFASWGAGGGYTIVVQNDDIKVSYCHVSPIYIVSRNDTVTAGQVISTVGPKNVYGINNNPYKDSDGNPTNGATTGCHLHLTIKENDIAIDPLPFFNYNF